MNRDAKTQSALVALARTRRMQRALAHAYVHRDAPMPTLRQSLGFMTSTARVVCDDACGSSMTRGARIAGDAGVLGHRMSILGIARVDRVAYIAEELAPGEAPIVYRMWTSGARAGHLVPIHAWYERGASDGEVRARIAALATTLEPVMRTTTEAWMLSTRVVQRRALRVADGSPPIRKFALQLRVEPTSGIGASGHTTVTAFLSPDASLVEVSALPDTGAIARVSYTGIPSGLGLPKETVILLTE